MSVTLQNSQVTILVKALPQPSKKYGETVCCAGVTPEGNWKRLYPIRFRHLQGDQSFKRWDIVDFKYGQPLRDRRDESCHVYEDSIAVVGVTPEREKSRMIERILVSSASEAAQRKQSLALIRPKNTKFLFKKKPDGIVQKEREAFKRAASQGSFFDKDLAALSPSTYRFGFQFEDSSGRHAYQCGDWEVNAMFYNGSRRMGENAALEWMNETFNVTYPKLGMTFALGNMAKRPQTWQLLGVIRANEQRQSDFGF
jgi:hypothetical protein